MKEKDLQTAYIIAEGLWGGEYKPQTKKYFKQLEDELWIGLFTDYDLNTVKEAMIIQSKEDKTFNPFRVAEICYKIVSYKILKKKIDKIIKKNKGKNNN